MSIAPRNNDVVMTPEQALAHICAQRTEFDPVTRKGSPLPMRRVFTTEGVHPYDTVEWTRRDVVLTNWRDGSENFRQEGVEFPKEWSLNAANIVTTKYFRGALGTEERETSLRQVIDRVVKTYRMAGEEFGYFASPGDAKIFDEELTWLLLHQYFSFNSPVWFNVGTKAPQQVSACFILAVDDSMESILGWYREEGLIFKGGSGAGLNLSTIRSSKELLSSGGTASGPISFMRGADASAGTIKSGGATRRAAKMVVLDVDHPDIEEFVELKAREEEKIRVLRDAGFDMDLGGRDIVSVQYQNANNSVRVNGDFMRAVEDGRPFELLSRRSGEVLETIDARSLWTKIAQAAWACADPGVQYDDTINDWHTNPETGRITASNPCSEYMSLDNSSCNLASLNLMKFLRPDGTFEVEKFVGAVELIITAMDISICFADFPTGKITDTTRRFRQLGIGYANLGALLMATGHAYDSEGGRGLAAAITSLMTGAAYRRSAELAGAVGPYEGYARNEDGHKRVMRKHTSAAAKLLGRNGGELDERAAAGLATAMLDGLSRPVAEAAFAEWERGLGLGEHAGWRNAQASLLAPTGTIGLMMDCDTTGIEPDFALAKLKKLVGGASMQIVNQGVPRALRALGYTEETVEAIVEYIVGRPDGKGGYTGGHSNVVGAPGLRPEHYAVFDCAMGSVRSIAPMGHIRMMAATQPFLSGAISKTVNLPQSATVEDIQDAYFQSWKLGLKAVAVYRDNCKVGQPLSDAGAKDKTKAAEAEVEEKKDALEIVEQVFSIFRSTTDEAVRARKIAALLGTSEQGARHEMCQWKPVRRRLPRKRPSQTVSFSVNGADGYVIAWAYPGDGLGEIFVKMSKQGSTLAGVMDAFSIAISIGLQYGVPLEAFVDKFTNMRFEPAGMTDDPDLRMAQSIMDYLFRRLALDYLPVEKRVERNILTSEERAAQVVGKDLTALADVVSAVEEEAHTGLGDATAASLVVASVQPAPAQRSTLEASVPEQDAPLCMTCGVKMKRAGSCYVCESCGSTSGCS